MGVATIKVANKLFTLSTLASIEFFAKVPSCYSRNLGKIKNVPLEHTGCDLLEYLKSVGVTSVQSQVAYL